MGCAGGGVNATYEWATGVLGWVQGGSACAEQTRGYYAAGIHMKLGFGTVLWGCRIDDLEYALDVIAACGYRGVEFAQHHEDLFVRGPGKGGSRPVAGIGELLRLMEARGLELLGLVAGSLRERMDFLQDRTYPYLYLDRWQETEAIEALEAGYTLALHPHWLMPLRRIERAVDIIRRLAPKYHGRVRLLLDTADSLIAEDDPVEIAKNHRRILAAVHLKSWKPDYGRWSHRYAHGYCLPGEGIVPVAEVVDELHAGGYCGWIVMEQDHYEVEREQTALLCAEWMAAHGEKWGIKPSVEYELLREIRKYRRVNPHNEAIGEHGVKKFIFDAINGRRDGCEIFRESFSASVMYGPLSEFALGRALARRVSHRPDPCEFYDIISDQIRQLVDARCVKIWSYNPLIGDYGELCLLGICAPSLETAKSPKILSAIHSLAAFLLARPTVRQFDLRDSRVAALYADKELLGILQEQAPWLVVLPVFNTSTSLQLRYLITIARTEPLLVPLGSDRFDREASFDRLGQLDAISRVIAHRADYLTDEICSKAFGGTNYLCGKHRKSVVEFIDALAVFLKTSFTCNQLTVFLEDATGERLEPAGTGSENLDWNSDAHYYDASDSGHLTYKAWRGREMVFSCEARTGKSREMRPADDLRDEILFAPLARRGGKCHGVVRLHNKQPPSQDVSSMFTDDDAAKLDAIIQSALPHLELLKEQERQIQALARMVHEFQIPLVAIRGAVDLMKTDLTKRGIRPEEFFRWDLFDDVLQWTEIMGRMTRNSRVFAAGAGTEPLRPQPISLLSQVVMPVLRQIRPLVPDGVRLDCHQEELKDIPPLWLDRNQMQQVFFNLLSNSIKHGGNQSQIRVVITGGLIGNSYSIFIQDWGKGIDEDDREEIFRPGIRGKRADLIDIAGQGLGCYVCREIVRAHGGYIRVRSCRNPTSFEIVLPLNLRNEKPHPKPQP